VSVSSGCWVATLSGASQYVLVKPSSAAVPGWPATAADAVVANAWIWAALAIFVLIGVVMNLYGGRMIDRIADTQDNAEMERLLARFRPWTLAVTGTGGLLVILFLMLFKPSF